MSSIFKRHFDIYKKLVDKNIPYARKGPPTDKERLQLVNELEDALILFKHQYHDVYGENL